MTLVSRGFEGHYGGTMNHPLHIPLLFGRLTPLLVAVGRLGRAGQDWTHSDPHHGVRYDRFGDLESMSLCRSDRHDDLESVSFCRTESIHVDRHDDLVDESLSRPDPAWMGNGWS